VPGGADGDGETRFWTAYALTWAPTASYLDVPSQTKEERMKRPSRLARVLQSAALLFGLVSALSFTASNDAPAQTAGRTLNVSGYGGWLQDMQKKVLGDPFAAKTNTKIAYIPAPGEHVAQVESQNRAGKIIWDMIWTSSGTDVVYMADKGLLAHYPPALLQKIRPVVSRDAWVDDFGVEGSAVASVIACNTKEAKACPKTPAEFFDVKNFPGPRTMFFGHALIPVILAELASGVPVDQLYPLNLDRAYAKLRELKPHIKLFYRSGDQSMQIIRDSEVVMGIMWDLRAQKLKDDGLPIQISFDGAPYERNYAVVLKGAPNADVAFKFIEELYTNPRTFAEYAVATRINIATPA
jgi:putative spermidine/putrescine transport system substrate-binding protein